VLNGYSQEICRFHARSLIKQGRGKEEECPMWEYWGKRAALGAGLGAGGVIAGLAVLPLFGMKAILGHLLAVKIAAAGGVAGMSTNMAMEWHSQAKSKGTPGANAAPKKRKILLPLMGRREKDEQETCNVRTAEAGDQTQEGE